MNDGPCFANIPETRVIFHWIIADSQHDVSPGEHFVSRLIPEESHAPEEQWKKFAGNRARALKCADCGHWMPFQERPDRSSRVGLAGRHAQQDGRTLRLRDFCRGPAN